MTIFWGFGGLFAVIGIVVGTLLLAWNLSSLITGLWLGRWITGRGKRGVTDLRAMLVGALLLGFLSGIPYVGYAFSVFSLFFAVGGVVHALSRLELRAQTESDDLVMPALRRS
jgi:hypothetical protein